MVVVSRPRSGNELVSRGTSSLRYVWGLRVEGPITLLSGSALQRPRGVGAGLGSGSGVRVELLADHPTVPLGAHPGRDLQPERLLADRHDRGVDSGGGENLVPDGQ